MSRRRISTAAPAVDNISSLPEVILCHILSFLPTKEAVATSVLSKRWTNLWHSVDTINFTDIQIHRSKSNYTFNESVYSVLVSRDAAAAGGSHLISSFCLKISYSNHRLAHLSLPNIIKWINLVVQRKLKHLSVDMWNEIENKVNQPQCRYEEVTIFHNLTQLKLYDGFNLAPQVLQQCPKLQNLDLYRYESVENEEDDQENWVEPGFVPQCLLSSLITCTIHDLSDLPSDFLLAKYILRNAKILQTMTICSYGEPSEIERKLLSCPKASATCRLLVS
ncbi:FBD-associated F-box protein At3g52670-like [Vicia villosa]|uniref:FBD-associated F-box protein At3g52670-like n=1 Tax=Vicia villosa TaxID=3911 RepID=UPI00273C7159|nr:FBD-associated F-box protein At3g52670-like [Vicia villosa]